MNDIHFRFTNKISDPWELLKDAENGEYSVNISLNTKKGMSFMDVHKTNIPAIVYSDFINDTSISSDTQGSYVVMSNSISDSLRLIEFTPINLTPISIFDNEYTSNNNTLYYYKSSFGYTYLSKGSELIFGDLYQTEVPDQSYDYDFSDWTQYLGNADLADIDVNNSYYAFSFHDKVTSTDEEKFISPIGIYSECTNNDSSVVVDLSAGDNNITTVLTSSNIIAGGLYIHLSNQDTATNRHNNYLMYGIGSVRNRRVYSNRSENITQVFGNVNIQQSASNNIWTLNYVYTGLREVSLSPSTPIQLNNTHINISTDVSNNDTTRALTSLGIDKNDHIEISSVRLKTIKKDRSSLIPDSIYDNDNDYICGYNDITGKCICSRL